MSMRCRMRRILLLCEYAVAYEAYAVAYEYAVSYEAPPGLGAGMSHT